MFDLFGSSVVWLLALFWYWLWGLCLWFVSGVVVVVWVSLFVIMIVAARLTALVLACLLVVFGWVVLSCWLVLMICLFCCFWLIVWLLLGSGSLWVTLFVELAIVVTVSCLVLHLGLLVDFVLAVLLVLVIVSGAGLLFTF